MAHSALLVFPVKTRRQEKLTLQCMMLSAIVLVVLVHTKRPCHTCDLPPASGALQVQQALELQMQGHHVWRAHAAVHHLGIDPVAAPPHPCVLPTKE
jgi:hypothetical protein